MLPGFHCLIYYVNDTIRLIRTPQLQASEHTWYRYCILIMFSNRRF